MCMTDNPQDGILRPNFWADVLRHLQRMAEEERQQREAGAGSSGERPFAVVTS